MSKSCQGFFKNITNEKPLNIFIDINKNKPLLNQNSDFFITNKQNE